jgi:hypothetical protein
VINLKLPIRPSTAALRAAIQDLLPITVFHDFHPDPNINFQLNRFLVPGLEQQFAEIGAKVKDFDDWKSLFLTAAAAQEQSGALGPAARLYCAAEFFMSPVDPNRRRTVDKFIELFYATARTMKTRLGTLSGEVYGFRPTPSRLFGRMPSAATSIEGLWISSAYTMSGGYSGAMHGGRMAADAAWKRAGQ